MSGTARESEYLVELLRCALHDTVPSEKPEELSWESIYALAKRHSVSALAYRAVQRGNVRLPAALAGEWEGQNAKLLAKYINQEYELAHLCETFAQEEIPYMPLKGSCIRHLFPSPELREMCDLDILVPCESEERTHQIMLGEGYSFIEDHTTSNNREYHKAPYLNVEIHTALYPQEYSESAYFNKVWLRAECSGGFSYKLPWDDFFIFAVAHTYKHYYLMGTGIRSVLDIYVMEEALKSQLNKAYIRAELKKLKMLAFYDALREMASFLFSGKETALSDAAENMMKYILGGSTYGTNLGLGQNSVSRYMRSGKGLRRAKVHAVIHMLFPPKGEMLHMYPVLKKASFLLPLCWVARWFRVLFSKPKKVLKFFGNIKKAKKT